MVSTNGSNRLYYAYILLYVDDILIIDKYLEQLMSLLKENYTGKQSSIREPKVYLCAVILKVYHPDGSYAWTMGSQSYIKEAICNVKSNYCFTILGSTRNYWMLNIHQNPPFHQSIISLN